MTITTAAADPGAVTLPASLAGQLRGHFGQARLVWSRRLGLHAVMPPALALDLHRALTPVTPPQVVEPAVQPIEAAPPSPAAAAVEPREDEGPIFSDALVGVFGRARADHGDEVVDCTKAAFRRAFPDTLADLPVFMARGLMLALWRRQIVRQEIAVADTLRENTIAGWLALFAEIKGGRQREEAFRRAIVASAPVAPPTLDTPAPDPPASPPSPTPRRSAPALIRLDPRAPSEMEKRGSASAARKPAFKGRAEREAEQLQAAIRHLRDCGYAVVSTRSAAGSLPSWTVSSFSGLFLGSHLVDLAIQRGFVPAEDGR